MHDPMIVAHEIKSWISHKSEMFPKGYKTTLVTIWHVDPETDHTDDSCGWFMRSRHGKKEVLDKIIKRFEFDWDRQYKPEKDEEDKDPSPERVYFCGYFYPEDAGAGMPNMSVMAIGLNLFIIAACEHFNSDGRTNWEKARRFMRKNIFDIMLFIENPTDSLRDSIVRKWGTETKREERIQDMAGCIYGWILRETRPWWSHPRWHIHHWKIQVHFLDSFKRWAFSRCCKCGKRFSWGYSPVANSWNSEGPKWFKGETDVFHSSCDQPTNPCVADAHPNSK